MAEVSFYLDTRRAKKDGSFPLKLYLYLGRKVERWYPIGQDLTREEYEKSYLCARPRKEHRELKAKLEAIKVKADSIVDKLGDEITFEKFEREFYRTRESKDDLLAHCEEYIRKLQSEGREGTADLYRLSSRSIREFLSETKGREISRLSFKLVTPDFLERYEKWFVNKGEGQSRTTVGIYLRNVRHLFNIAIKEGDIAAESYPFKVYKIPTGRNVKKAFENEYLKALYSAPVEKGSLIEKARDFWFFSFQCNGMNFRDIAELKWRNLSETSFSFVRHKTMNTTKDDPKPIIVFLTPQAKATIEKYGGSSRGPNDYVFPIFTKGMDEKEKLRVNRKFIRFVSQHMQSLADRLQLGIRVNTLAARHSFTTKVTRSTGNLVFAQEALGHKTLSTTQNYWAGFEDQVKKEIAESLMDF